MNTLSPALLADLTYAVGRYGLTLDEVPRDQDGKSITDRLAMLLDAGESYCYSEFTRADLRSDTACVWKLFPENRKTARTQIELIDEVGELLHDEEEFRTPPRTSLVRHSELPRAEHVEALETLLRAIDSDEDAPEVNSAIWSDVSLFEEAAQILPGYRAAQAAATARAQLIAELTTGEVPPVAAVYVRKALDSEVDGLRNADITLAGYQVAVGRIRDAAVLALDALRPHFEVAERIRALRDDLDLIDDALHWPGPWRTVPELRVVLAPSL